MGVARVKSVGKARKDQGKCGGCDKPILAGDAYKWWTIGFRSRYKNKRCEACPVPPPSARESNEKIATIMAAEEGFNPSNAACRDDLVSILEEAAENIRSAGEMWTESAEAMEQGFGHETEQSCEQQEKAEAAEAWADSIDEAAQNLDEEQGDDEDENAYLERLRDEAQSAFDDNRMDC